MSEKKTEWMVPETLEGWAALHELFQVDWSAWKKLTKGDQDRITSEAVDYFSAVTRPPEGESALFSMLGHKADLLILHFRRTLDELNQVELASRQIRIFDYLKESTSYVSFVELGLYEMTVKLVDQLSAEGLAPDSEEWSKRWKAAMSEQAERMKARIFPTIPKDRYICFYPMDKKRGENKNWYAMSIAERQRMMRDHGMIGRKYGDRVTQIISGSIGFDDWEWGVDLFARDPLVFKKLIYEMRFDEASAHYALFGTFYTGVRFSPEGLKDFFSGRCPKP